MGIKIGYTGKLLTGEIIEGAYYIVKPTQPLRRLEYSHVPSLKKDLASLIEEIGSSGLEVCLNLEDVGNISKEAFAPLVSFMKKYEQGKRHLVVPAKVRSIIEIMGFESFFNLYDRYDKFEEYIKERVVKS